MPPMQSRPGRILAAACLLLGTCACAPEPDPPQARGSAAQAEGCLPGGDGSFEADVRGALTADLRWNNADMQCDGSPHPDRRSIRVTIAGPLPGSATRLRFIFGIDLHDAASGVAQAYPTNLTVLVEGGQQLFATRGHDKCAVETLQRTPLTGNHGRLDRVKVRGYCIDPASDIAGTTRLLVPTFSFTALLQTGDDP
jgi:hypothetical protein